MLIGAPFDDSAGLDAGAVYLVDPGSAHVLSTITNPNPAFPGSAFGSVLTASGLQAAVGAPLDDSAAADAGGVYLYNLDPSSAGFGGLTTTVRSPNTSSILSINASSGATESGNVVTIKTTTAHGLAVGQRIAIAGVGAGYNGVFTVASVTNSTTFTYSHPLAGLAASGGGTVASNPGMFGSSLAFAGNRLLVGSESDNTSVGNSGSAFLIDADPGSATFGTTLQTFRKLSPVAGDRFGAAVAFMGDDVLIGSPQDGATVAGSVYRFLATSFVKSSATTINESDTVTVSGSFADAGASDTHTAVIDWGEGNLTTIPLPAGISAFSASHQYLDDNPTGTASDNYPIRVKVLDNTPDVLLPELNSSLGRYEGTTNVRIGRFTATTPPGRSYLAVGPDGDLFAANGSTGTVYRHSGVTGAILGTFISSGVGRMAFGPDGNLYALNLANDRVLRYDGRTGASMGTFIAPGTGGIAGVVDLAFGPDGNLYLAGDDNKVYRFNGATGASAGILVSTLQPEITQILNIAFGPDGTLYMAGLDLSLNVKIVRHDGATGDPQGVFAQTDFGFTGQILITPDGSLYVISSGVFGADKFDTSTGEQVANFTGPIAGFLAAINPQDDATTTLTVTNVAPSVIVHAAPGNTTTQVNLTAVASDPGTLDTLSYSWSVTNGTNPVGANTPNFSFTPGSGTITVTLTVTDDDTGSTTTKTQIIVGTTGNDTINVSNPATGTTRVIVLGLAGNDTINASGVSTVPVELVGGAGSDTLTGGTKDDLLLGDSPGGYGTSLATATDDHSADSLVGGPGNDSLDGGLGNDTMEGGTGNDDYIEVPGSDDVLTEATGLATDIDSIDYSLAYSGITFSLAKTGVTQTVDGSSTVKIIGQFENLAGSQFADSLTGNEVDNLIIGGMGNDIIFGGDPLNTLTAAIGSGQDTLTGGQGSDTVIGGSGNDIIFGGDRLTTLSGGTGVTTVTDSGSNSLVGGKGNDTVIGGSGNDIIFGGDPLSTLPGGTTSDDNSLVGGAGNDTVIGGSGNDIIFGGDRLTTLSGGTGITTVMDGNNSLIGGKGNDTVIGGLGNDIIFGGDPLTTLPSGTGSDDNSLVGGAGNDTVIGGTGNDIIFGGDRLTTLSGGTGTNDGNNSLIGGKGNDTVIGGTGNDIIFGGDPLVTLPGGTGSDDNSLQGGAGNDTVIGGTGNDIIFGGDPLTTLAGGTSPDNDSLSGGAGNDTVSGGTGNDIIFGGDPLTTLPAGTADDDSLSGGTGNDTMIGGTGNDIIFGGDRLTTLSGGSSNDDDSITGGKGNDTVVGGTGNDIIFGGDPLTTMTGGSAPDDGNDSLQGGGGNDTLAGGTGNDIIFGGDGDDALSGGDGNDVVDGGSGKNTIVETADSDILLNPTQLFIGGVPERFYDVQSANLTGGAGNNRIDALPFGGPVTLSGGAGDDTLIGGNRSDQLFGGDGNDSLIGNAGPDLLNTGNGLDTADGGDGNDIYVLNLSGKQTLRDSAGIDSIDLSDAAFGVNADLTGGTIDTEAPTPVLVADLTGGTFENLRGTSFSDALTGNSDRNILEGGGGIDTISGGVGADNIQGSFPQVIYLDFDSGTGIGEHVYTIEERNLIQAKLEQAFAAPFSVTFSQTAPSVGRFTTVVVNAGEAEALAGGISDELDWRNEDAASRAQVNVNGFLGRKGQAAATSENYVNLTFTVMAHEIGHLFGLRHTDSFGPIGSGIYAGLESPTAADIQLQSDLIVVDPRTSLPSTAYALNHTEVLLAPVTQLGNSSVNTFALPSGAVYLGTTAVASIAIDNNGVIVATPIGNPSLSVIGGTLIADSGVVLLQWSEAELPQNSSIQLVYQYDPFRPGYRGPDNAVQTPMDIMASPASVGTSLADAIGNTYFGERDLIKLAFDDASASVQETDLPATGAPSATGSANARDLGPLPGLAVPNLIPNSTQEFEVHAANVVGVLDGSGPDVYAIQARPGDLLTAEIYSYSLRNRVTNPIDSILRIYDDQGNLLNWYGQPAVNDDGIDNQDAMLQDVTLPGDPNDPTLHTYYIQVSTFQPSDTGDYELFLYTDTPSATGRQAGAGDVLIGGPDADILIGSSGDDQFVGDLSEDVFIGYIPGNDLQGLANTPPTATVTHNTSSPTTNDILVATAAVADNENNAVTLTYVWTVGSTVVKTTTGTASLTDTLDLSLAGNGDRGDTITVTVTPNDGTVDGDPATASATVANSAPTATPLSTSAEEDTPLNGTLSGSDADSDTLTFALAGTPTGGTISIQNDGNFAFTPDSDFNGTASFQFTVSDGTATSAAAMVTIDVSAVNDAPVAVDDAYTTDEDNTLVVASPGVLANDSDVDSSNLTALLVDGPQHGSVTLNADGSFTYVPNSDYNGSDSFTYKANDGSLDSSVATVSITVDSVNDPPTASVTLTPASPRTNDLLVATVTTADADGDTVNVGYVWKRNGVEITGQTGSTLDLSIAGNGNRGDTITVEVTPNDGTTDGEVAAASATVANTAPTVSADSASVAKNEGSTASNTGTFADVDADTITLSASIGSVTPNADGTWSWSFDTSDGPADSQTVTVYADDGSGGTASTSFGLTVNNVAPTATLAQIGSTTYGDDATVAVNDQLDPSSADTSAGFHYAYSIDDNGDGLSSATYENTSSNTSSQSFSGLSAGAHTVYARIIDKDDGYSQLTATITVDPKQASVTPNAVNKTYGDADPTLTGTLSGFLDSDGVTATYSRTTGEDVADSPYTISAVLSSSGDLNNYAITYNTASFTIDARPIAVTADALSKIYGQADPSLTYQITSGDLVNNDGFTGDLSRVVGENVGSYAIHQNTLTAGGNYDLTFIEANLVISQATTTATASSDGSNPPFGSAVTFTATIAPQYAGIPTGTVQFQIDGSNSGDPVTLDSTGKATYSISSLSARSHTVTAVYAGDTNFSSSTSADFDQSIAKAEQTITFGPLDDKTYGDGPITLSATGGESGNPVTFSVSGPATIDQNLLTITGAGTVTVTASQAGDSNYAAAADVTPSFDVAKAELTVSVDDTSRAYGDANPTFTGSITGIQNSDNITATYGSTADASSAVGDYSITPTLSDPDDRLSNYTVTTVNGTLAVIKAHLTVTADNKTRIYGDANPTLTATITGFKNDEALANSGVTGAASLSTSATETSNVGLYAISVSQGTLAAGNYDFTSFVAGSLDVQKATLTVTADDKSRAFGASDPEFTVSYSGFKNGETLTSSGVTGSPSVTSNDTPTSPPGTYTIVVAASTLAANNYAFAFVNGTLTITQTGTSTTVLSSAPNPAVLGETITFTAVVGPSSGGSALDGNVDFFDTSTNTDLGVAALSANHEATWTTSALGAGTHIITATYLGNANYVSSQDSLSETVASIFVLSSSTASAVNITGNATIDVPGAVYVDSNASNAIRASGNASITAPSIQVVGHTSVSGHALLSPSPTTGAAAVADPMAALPVPTGLTNQGSVQLSSNSSLTISPGIYTKISVAANAHLTMQPGVYAIAGGGFTVSGNASLTGDGVTIYNAGSNYPNSGGSFGSIALSGNGEVNLSAPTSGMYTGVLIFQARDNSKPITLSGNAVLGLNNGYGGIIYAPAAPLKVSGNVSLAHVPLVVATLSMSGSAGAFGLASGSESDYAVSTSNQIMNGVLTVAVQDDVGIGIDPTELDRIGDAMTYLNSALGSFGVDLTWAAPDDYADVHIHFANQSPHGGMVDGVLGFTTVDNDVYLINGWDFYNGSDATQIGENQFDFLTLATHELGHTIGLGESIDPDSVMYEYLSPGNARRSFTGDNLTAINSDVDRFMKLGAPINSVAPIPASAINESRIEAFQVPTMGDNVTLGSLLDPTNLVLGSRDEGVGDLRIGTNSTDDRIATESAGSPPLDAEKVLRVNGIANRNANGMEEDRLGKKLDVVKLDGDIEL